MKKILRLTYDIETVTTGFSLSGDYWHAVLMGALTLARALEERGLKATFFLSLSRKTPKIRQSDFDFMLETLMSSIRGFKNISLQPHIHAFGLPVGFKCESDHFSDYSYDQQLELLAYAKEVFEKHGIQPTAFRPGGYSLNDQYYRALKDSGFRRSSVVDKSLPPHIDLIESNVNDQDGILVRNEIEECPVTSVRLVSVKRKEELINLSPDFFALDSIKDWMERLSSLTVNAHSFSMFIPRLMRETHKGQTLHNMKFMALTRFFNRWLVGRNVYPMYMNTMAGKENIKWLDYFAKGDYLSEWL